MLHEMRNEQYNNGRVQRQPRNMHQSEANIRQSRPNRGGFGGEDFWYGAKQQDNPSTFGIFLKKLMFFLKGKIIKEEM